MAKLTSCLTRFKIKPRLIIFDLDETLWPFGIDEYVLKPPYRKLKEGGVVDAEGTPMKPYPEVNLVLQTIDNGSIRMAAASRTTFPEGAFLLIKLFGWDRYFKFREIYPGSKVEHFKNLRQKSQTPYSDMLFFDNEMRNIFDVTDLGVTSMPVDSKTGVDMKTLIEGFERWTQDRKK